MYGNALKYLILVPLFCVLLFSFKTNHNDLERTIVKIVKAFQDKDAKTLNSLIHKNVGLIVLFKRGIPDEYEKTDKIDFGQPIPGYLPYFDILSDYKIKYESLPYYDCDSMKWSKIGIFCDTINKDNLLSSTASHLEKNRGVKVPKSEIERFEEIENNSYRIVLSDNNEGELVFYLTKIENKWYLTILDRLTSDCSA